MRHLLFLLLFSFGLAGSVPSFAAEKIMSLEVKGMSCPICAGAVERQIRRIPGVKNVQIHLSQGKATVVADESVTTEHLRKAVEEAGFTPGDIEKSEVSK